MIKIWKVVENSSKTHFRIAIFRRMLQPLWWSVFYDSKCVAKYTTRPSKMVPNMPTFHYENSSKYFVKNVQQSEESGKKQLSSSKRAFSDSHLWEDVVTSVVVRFIRFKVRCKDLRKNLRNGIRDVKK
ncbi:hypothetical protein Adt_07062 [Abeliophyllum distichum]|uniref:Uncharacterized protein n=1 Tax=Abeliophyllum distichum TaxID=126358 RepID=A0ABD1V8Q9_9LAMI